MKLPQARLLGIADSGGWNAQVVDSQLWVQLSFLELRVNGVNWPHLLLSCDCNVRIRIVVMEHRQQRNYFAVRYSFIRCHP